jgi:hypothetical protein
VSPNEEFTASLGVDQSLRITCQPVESVHNTRSGLLGGNKAASISYTHKFLVKNTKDHSVNIHLSEQVPLSTDDRIKVSQWLPLSEQVPDDMSVAPQLWAIIARSVVSYKLNLYPCFFCPWLYRKLLTTYNFFGLNLQHNDCALQSLYCVVWASYVGHQKC